MIRLTLLTGYFLLFLQTVQAGVIVYQNDFESGIAGPEFSGIRSVESTQGYANYGFGNAFLRNATGPFANTPGIIATTLTLTDLPNHDSIDLSFLLAVIDSWDGNDETHGADSFQISIDGDIIFFETFSNFIDRPQTADTTNRIANLIQLGFSSRFVESAYNFTAFPSFIGIPHTSDRLVLSFTASGPNYLGGSDESFAIDNLTVRLNTFTSEIPEPAGIGVLGLGLISVAQLLHRRRSA